MPIDPVEAQLQAILRRLQTFDWSLDRLLSLGDAGLGVGLTLIVDSGLVIKGFLARPEQWAETLDNGIDEGMRQLAERKAREQGPVESVEALSKAPRGVGVGDVEWLRSMLAKGSFGEHVKQRRDNDERLRDAIEQATKDQENPDFYDLPEELARELIDVERHVPAVTLQHARVAAPGGTEYQVPIIRVLVSHVAAWYLGA